MSHLRSVFLTHVTEVTRFAVEWKLSPFDKVAEQVIGYGPMFTLGPGKSFVFVLLFIALKDLLLWFSLMCFQHLAISLCTFLMLCPYFISSSLLMPLSV